MIDDINNRPVKGSKKIMDFIKTNTITHEVYVEIKTFIDTVSEEFSKRPTWSRGMILRGPFSKSTLQGERLRVYLLDIFTFPAIKHSANESELQEAEKLTVISSLFLQVNEQEEIVAIIDAVKPH